MDPTEQNKPNSIKKSAILLAPVPYLLVCISGLDARQQVEPLCTYQKKFALVKRFGACKHTCYRITAFSIYANSSEWFQSCRRNVVRVAAAREWPVRLHKFLFILIDSFLKVSVNTSCTWTEMHEWLIFSTWSGPNEPKSRCEST